MTTDEKIEEVLKVVRETREMTLEERALNNSRFTQLAAGLSDVRKEVNDVKTGLVAVNGKIDRFYDSLSQDIQVFGEDLQQVKKRVTRLEKKMLS